MKHDNKYNDPKYIDQAWSDMANVLDEHMPEKKKRRKSFFWILGGIVVVLAFLLGYVWNEYLSSPDKQQSMSTVNINTERGSGSEFGVVDDVDQAYPTKKEESAIHTDGSAKSMDGAALDEMSQASIPTRRTEEVQAPDNWSMSSSSIQKAEGDSGRYRSSSLQNQKAMPQDVLPAPHKSTAQQGQPITSLQPSISDVADNDIQKSESNQVMTPPAEERKLKAKESKAGAILQSSEPLELLPALHFMVDREPESLSESSLLELPMIPPAKRPDGFLLAEAGLSMGRHLGGQVGIGLEKRLYTRWSIRSMASIHYYHVISDNDASLFLNPEGSGTAEIGTGLALNEILNNQNLISSSSRNELIRNSVNQLTCVSLSAEIDYKLSTRLSLYGGLGIRYLAGVETDYDYRLDDTGRYVLDSDNQARKNFLIEHDIVHRWSGMTQLGMEYRIARSWGIAVEGMSGIQFQQDESKADILDFNSVELMVRKRF